MFKVLFKIKNQIKDFQSFDIYDGFSVPASEDLKVVKDQQQNRLN